MATKKSEPENNSKSSGDGQRKNKGFRQHHEGVLKSSDGICTLKLTNGWDSNLIQFTDDIFVYAGTHIGNINIMLRTLKLEEPTCPELPEELENEEEDAAVDRKQKMINILWEEDVRAFRKAQFKYKEDKIKLFSLIWSHMSVESKCKVQERAGAVWADAEVKQNPLTLWEWVRETHVNSVTGITKLDRREIRNRYNSMRMRADETLISFKKRYDDVLTMYTSLDMQHPKEDEVALEFILRLEDGRYKAFKDMLRQQVLSGLKEYPVHILEAMQLATLHETKRPTVNQTHSATFATETNSKEKKGKANANAPAVSKTEETDKKKKPYNGTCFKCDKKGHIAQNCPFKADIEAAIEERQEQQRAIHALNATYFAKVETYSLTRKNQIVFDTGSQDHLFGESNLVLNVRRSRMPMHFGGINGTLTADYIGDYNGEIVYINKKANVNILSVGKLLRNGCKMRHNPESNVLDLTFKNGFQLRFCLKNDIYVSEDVANTYVTSVEEKKVKYTRQELTRAEEARKLQEKLGYPSTQALLDVLHGGAIINVPVTAHDVVRSVDIYGPSVPMLKGKSKKMKTKLFNEEKQIRTVSSMITLHIDIMFIDDNAFLVGVGIPIGLVSISVLGEKLGKRSEAAIHEAIEKQLIIYQKNNFAVTEIQSDGEGAIARCSEYFPTINFKKTAAGSHDGHVENKIKVLKETVRSIIHGLPYVVSRRLLPWAVRYSAYVLNLRPNKTGYIGLSPREALTGIKTDFRRDLKISFGEYCQVVERDLDATMKQRTVGAIAVLPTGNISGSVMFISLWTGKVIIRDQFTILPIPSNVIDLLNNWSKSNALSDDFMLHEVRDDAEEAEIVDKYIDVNRQTVIAAQENENVVADEPIFEETTVDDAEVSETVEEIPVVEELEEEPEVVESETVETLRAADEPPEEPQSQRYDFRQRSNRGGVRDGGALYQSNDFINFDVSKGRKKMFSMSVSEAMTRHGAAARTAIEAELHGHQEKPAWRPLNHYEFQRLDKKCLLRTMWVIVEKFDANGMFDKIKARLVAVGSQQDRTLYDDTSSPTASITSIFMVAAIAAMEQRNVCVADVKTAYMHAKIGKIKSYLLLDRVTTQLLVDNYSEWKKYVLPNGNSCVEALRAFYGLIESAKLWHEEISTTLKEMGFKSNDSDLCVFNIGDIGEQITVVVYVDDLLITSKYEQKIKWVIEILSSKYGELKWAIDKSVNFLGMNFNFDNTSVKIMMPKYIQTIIEETGINGTSETPATGNLFEIKDSPALEVELREIFHTRVAKLLYLAKRIRGDILLPVNFLCTRVSAPTEQDWEKLEKILKYLNGTKMYGLNLECSAAMQLTGYIDAAYAPHSDAKSHSGFVLTLGKGALLVKSSKQHIVTKSSTEAEVVAASDMATDILNAQSFLMNQGYKMRVPILLQDNQSAIRLLENGRMSSQRTRHLNVRYFWLKEKIDENAVKVKYEPTKSMLADMLTKPLGGEQFKLLTRALLNEEKLKNG